MPHFIDQQGEWDVWGDWWGILVADPPTPTPPAPLPELAELVAGCELWVGGLRVADTAAALRDGDPTALAGLTVTWGRATTVDQPDVSTCSFTIRDPAGGGAFLGAFYTGAPVEVWASARVYAGAGTMTNYAVDGSFETTDPVGDRATGLHLAYSALASDGARGIASWTPHVDLSGVTVPPAPFSDDLTAWDQVPAVTAGERWTVSLDIHPPEGLGYVGPGGVDLQIVSYAGPADRRPRLLAGAVIDTAVNVGSGFWRVTASGFGGVLDAGRWLGVRASMTGPWTSWQNTAGTWATQDDTWAALSTIVVDRLQLYAPASAQRRVLVWAGRITNLAASPDLGGGLVIAAAAADVSAELANRIIGAEPWPAEPAGDRFARVVDLSGLHLVTQLDAAPAALEVSWQDVDATAAWSLLADLADSTGAVLWPATHATLGAYLFLEDIDGRPASIQLVDVAGVPTITGIPAGAGARAATILSACDLLAEPITWVTDVSDRLTTVDVTWQEQTLGSDGLPAPTERHVQVTDAAAELLYGVRRLSVGTQLTSAGVALSLASRTLAQHDQAPWRIAGARWDTAITPSTSATINDLADLLDGTIRLGRRIIITDLPGYAPLAGPGPDLAVYLEGGQYTFEAPGRWVLDLTVSPALGLGESVTWAELDPDWDWADFPPAISWRSLYGVAAPT